jgi:CheY-like chemotaxis protein
MLFLCPASSLLLTISLLVPQIYFICSLFACRTPMNGIIGATDLLLHSADLNGEHREILHIIKNSGGSLLVLLNDILDLSKVEAGKFELVQEHLRIRELIESSVDICCSSAFAKGLEIICTIDPMIPAFVLGDPTRIRQILVNLLSNAIKFTNTGQITLDCSCKPLQPLQNAIKGATILTTAPRTTRTTSSNTKQSKQAAISLNGAEESLYDYELLVSITDSGIGIAQDDQEQLFKPFSQIQQQSHRSPGTGLGLAVCKTLIELMNGRIWVDSERPGKGSKFSFKIQTLGSPQTMQADYLMPAPEQSWLKEKKVLLLKENAVVSERIVELLRYWGMHCDWCTELKIDANSHGTSASSASPAYNITLLDYRMVLKAEVLSALEPSKSHGSVAKVGELSFQLLLDSLGSKPTEQVLNIRLLNQLRHNQSLTGPVVLMIPPGHRRVLLNLLASTQLPLHFLIPYPLRLQQFHKCLVRAFSGDISPANGNSAGSTPSTSPFASLQPRRLHSSIGFTNSNNSISISSNDTCAVSPPSERLLVAEDNVTNRKLLLRMLIQLGYKNENISTVENGALAVEAIKEHNRGYSPSSNNTSPSFPYSVIMMDLQMPSMNGDTATRAIRSLDPDEYIQPYIVALTANAMQGDRELCLESGMDDYCCKPITLKELKQALQKVPSNLKAYSPKRSSPPLLQ